MSSTIFFPEPAGLMDLPMCRKAPDGESPE